MQKLSDQNPGLQISLYYPHGKDFFLGAKTKIKKVDSEKNDVKVVNIVFFQYRNARTLEIEGHFCPVIDMKKFVATKYLLKQPKNPKSKKYTLYRPAVICHHCGMKFRRDSDTYIQHVDSCLKDTPTYQSMPKKGSQYTFVDFQNAIPSVYSLMCDLESENIDCKRACGFCDAKLYYETDKDQMIRILRDCDHPKEKFRSCEHCTLKILRLRKEAVSTCKKNNHIITKEGIDVCNDCEKKLSQKEDSVKHDSTHVVPCSVCPSQETEYCIHNSTQKMRSLSPLIYSVVVFDNVKRQVRNTATYGGPNAVGDFFAYLDELRPTLEAEHAGHCQRFPDINKLWRKKRIDLYKKRHNKCWNCFKELALEERVLDHCHTTARIRG